MDYVAWIKEALNKSGGAKTQRGLAQAMGLDPAVVNRLLKGKRVLKAHEIASAQAYLEGSANRPLAVGNGVSQTLSFSGSRSLDGPRDLRVLGYVKGGREGFFIDNGEVQGMTARPDFLAGVKDAYAVYVHEDSMFPAFEPGHLAWVNPLKPVKPGDSVVVQLGDGQSFIKRLKRRTEKFVICEQWNPAEEVKYKTSDVRAVHLVVGSNRQPG